MIKIEIQNATYNQRLQVIKEMRAIHGPLGILWGFNSTSCRPAQGQLLTIWARNDNIDQLPAIITQLALTDSVTIALVNETKETYLK